MALQISPFAVIGLVFVSVLMLYVNDTKDEWRPHVPENNTTVLERPEVTYRSYSRQSTSLSELMNGSQNNTSGPAPELQGLIPVEPLPELTTTQSSPARVGGGGGSSRRTTQPAVTQPVVQTNNNSVNNTQNSTNSTPQQNTTQPVQNTTQNNTNTTKPIPTQVNASNNTNTTIPPVQNVTNVTQPPQQNTTPSFDGAVTVNVLGGFPQDHVYVFKCNADFEATSYYWEFGDGTAATTEDNVLPDQAYHVFREAGEYDVTCTAANEQGDATGTKSIDVSTPVASINVNAPFYAIISSSQNGNAYTFSCETSGYKADSFQWYINGEEAATKESFTHTFTDAGDYEVSCRADSFDEKYASNFYSTGIVQCSASGCLGATSPTVTIEIVEEQPPEEHPIIVEPVVEPVIIENNETTGNETNQTDTSSTETDTLTVS
jgi:hypothetical protein